MDNSIFESNQEFFDLWLKNYNATMGKLTEMPALGPDREKYEMFMKNYSSFMDLHKNWMDSNANFQTVFMEAMRRLQEKITTEMSGDVSPEKSRNFYKLWIDTYSETFKEFMQSDHYAKDMGNFTSYLMEFQKNNRELIEKHYLKPMNLPTKAEIDEINKEIYSLKKTVKELSNQIKELSG